MEEVKRGFLNCLLEAQKLEQVLLSLDEDFRNLIKALDEDFSERFRRSDDKIESSILLSPLLKIKDEMENAQDIFLVVKQKIAGLTKEIEQGGV